MALQRAHIETASLDARLLLQHVLNVSREQLLVSDRLGLSPMQEAHFRDLIDKRAHRQPVAQLLGKREFYGRDFKVTKATLDPRPDSETLIETVLARILDKDAPLKLLDLGTGTGCLLITLLKELPMARGLAVDISDEALQVARENAAALGVGERIEFMQSCWAEKVAGKFDIILSNPPYIPAAAIALLAPEVSRYEPKLALDGGADGLDCYRAIMAQLPGLLTQTGWAVLEIGIGQRRDMEELAQLNGLQVVAVKQDLSSIPRCVVIEKITTNQSMIE